MTIFSELLNQEISLILELNNKLNNPNDGHIKGTVLEARLYSLLRKFLPNNIDVVRGWITDEQGQRSDERDCLIYDKSKAPAFLFDNSTGIIPLLSILYDIQIKSKLTEKTIRQAYEKFDNRVVHNALIGNNGTNILKIYENIDPNFYESPKIQILLSEKSSYYVFQTFYKDFDDIFDFNNSIQFDDGRTFKVSSESDKRKITINGINLQELCKKKVKICRWTEYPAINSPNLKTFFIGMSNTLYHSSVGVYLTDENENIKYLSLLVLDHNNNVIYKKKIGEKLADSPTINNLNLTLSQDGEVKLSING